MIFPDPDRAHGGRVKVDPAVLSGLTQISSATIASELYKREILRPVMVGVRSVVPPSGTVVGIARTLRQVPSRGDLDSHGASRGRDVLLYDIVESIEPPEVLVVDARGELSGGVAGGGIVAERLAQRGAVAVVTDGAVRDVAELEQIGLPMFAGGASPGNRKSALHMVDIDVPIGCGGVAVYPGDVILADRDGVVVIPSYLAEEILADARGVELEEEQVMELVKSGRSLRGLYPLAPKPGRS